MTRLERRRDALQVATTQPPVAMASTPCALRNALNGSGGTTKGARYAANARRAMERGVGRRLALRLARELPEDAAVVVLTRISPRPFDDDGTTASLKSVRDGMAEWWGIDDADPRVTWETDWRKGKAHVVEAALWFVPLAPVWTEPPKGFDVLATLRKHNVRVVMGLADVAPSPSDVEVDASDYERPRKPGEWLPMPHKDSPTVKP